MVWIPHILLACLIKAVKFQESQGSIAMSIDKSCTPRDCSQPPLKAGLPAFPCSIGHRNECDNATSIYHGNRVPIAFHSFALLAAIGTYMYRDKTKPQALLNPSLNFTIKTPFGGRESLLTKGVKVVFSSPKGYGEDSFYSKNPRCRIFDFSTAIRQTFDISHPRELNYPCLIGLSIRNEMTYNYQLKLTSLPSFAVTDYFLIVHSEPRSRETYKVVLATAVIDLHRSVHVVWERPPVEFHIVKYEVTLRTDEEVLLSVTTKYGDEEWEFMDLLPNDYVVKVEPKTRNGSSPCFYTESKPVRLLYQIEDEETDDQLLKTALAVVCGIVMAIILLLVTLLCLRKRMPRYPISHQGRDTVIIIGSDSDKNMMIKLEQAIRKILGLNVKLGNVVSSISFENLFRDMTNNSKILIICSKNSSELASKINAPNYSNDYFCRALKYIKMNPLLCSKTFITCVYTNTACVHEHVKLEVHNEKKTFLNKLAVFSEKNENKVFNLLDDFTELAKNLRRGQLKEDYRVLDSWKKLKASVEVPKNDQNERNNLSISGSMSSISEYLVYQRSMSSVDASSVNSVESDELSMDRYLQSTYTHDVGSESQLSGRRVPSDLIVQHESMHNIPDQSTEDMRKYASCETVLSRDIEPELPSSYMNGISEMPENDYCDSGFLSTRESFPKTPYGTRQTIFHFKNNLSKEPQNMYNDQLHISQQNFQSKSHQLAPKLHSRNCPSQIDPHNFTGMTIPAEKDLYSRTQICPYHHPEYNQIPTCCSHMKADLSRTGFNPRLYQGVLPQIPAIRSKHYSPERSSVLSEDHALKEPLLSSDKDSGFDSANSEMFSRNGHSLKDPLLERSETDDQDLPTKYLWSDGAESPKPDLDHEFLPPDPDGLSCSGEFFIEYDASGEAYIASKMLNDYSVSPNQTSPSFADGTHRHWDYPSFERSNSVIEMSYHNHVVSKTDPHPLPESSTHCSHLPETESNSAAEKQVDQNSSNTLTVMSHRGESFPHHQIHKHISALGIQEQRSRTPVSYKDLESQERQSYYGGARPKTQLPQKEVY